MNFDDASLLKITKTIEELDIFTKLIKERRAIST